MVIMDGSGKVNTTTSEEIDLEIELDEAPTRQAAMAAENNLQAIAAARTTRDRAPRRQNIGVRRRTCTGGRRRPGARRTARSTASSGGAESDSDGPGERPRRLLLLGVRDRRLADSLCRIGAVVV
jgi:hypothetical protein